MIYLLGILISFAAGFLLIRLMVAQRLNLILHILLALALGLGIDGTVAFYTHILFNQFNRFLPIGLVVAGIFILFFINNKKLTPYPLPLIPYPSLWGLLTLGILAVPLAVGAHYFPLGGWDAWSCWNLKAKFIFLGQENWKDMLASGLWRSNTQYPLLWPLINVWFWDLGGRFDQAVPMLNSVVIALLTAGVLLFGLLELTGMLWVSITAAVIVTALPFGVILYISQYSDALMGLYLLSAFMCLLLAEKHDLPKLKILGMVFLGLMSFTKNEGLVAAGITALGLFWQERSHKKELKALIIAFVLALLPTIIFTLFMAPKNEAFINGLVSTDKPTNWARVSVILAYPWFEIISWKWNGFWLLACGGILLAGRKLWQGKIVTGKGTGFGLLLMFGWILSALKKGTLRTMAFSLILYLGVVMAYYAVNTYFEIGWWLGQTLSRILFVLVPTIALWIGLALCSDNIKDV
jgi:hypothetical protein